MDLILHIGCEKTGTSSLQRWLDHNAQVLPQHHVMFSKVLERPNNRRLAIYGLENGRQDELLLHAGIKSAKDHDSFRERMRYELKNEALNAGKRGIKHFIISNEHLQSRCTKDENVAALRDLLVPLFDRVRVCVFVRPQVDTCLSLASTSARNGREVSRQWMERALRTENPYYDMVSLLDRWARFFGKENVEPVAFKRCKDVIAYMEEALELTDVNLPRIKAVNEALDYRVIALCNAMQLRSVENGELNNNRKFYIEDLPVEQKLTLDRKSAMALQERFAAQNAELCREWPQFEPDDMVPDWNRYPEEGNIDRVLDLMACGPILRYVVERYNAELWWHQARWAAAQAARDGLMAKLDEGIKVAEFGLRAVAEAMRSEVYQEKGPRLSEKLELRLDRLRTRKQREEAELAAAAEFEKIERKVASLDAIL